jgi:hypothetical protein
MNRVRIENLEYKQSYGDKPFFSILANVDTSDIRARLSYDDIEEALNRGFNHNILGKSLTIKKVIYNGPATIVLWNDGTKTVVKCKEGDPYSPEAGFALAVLKRLTGNDFHKYLRKATKGSAKNESGELL